MLAAAHSFSQCISTAAPYLVYNFHHAAAPEAWICSTRVQKEVPRHRHHGQLTWVGFSARGYHVKINMSGSMVFQNACIPARGTQPVCWHVCRQAQ